MKSWGLALVALTMFSTFTVFFVAACDDDEDEDQDDESSGVAGECLAYEDTTCLNYCRCLREDCLEGADSPADEAACDDAMCACADTHGCLIEDVVTEYDCQAVD